MSDPSEPRTGGQSISAGLVGQCREPLFRNGHALNASAVIASAIGLGFWVLAAHHYPMAVVGRNSVAVLVLMFIGGAAQLNLASALVCFLPRAGRRTSGFVASTYAVSATVAVLLAIVFLVLVPHMVPALDFLVANSWLALWFILSAAVWAVFVLEDGALTGLRRTPWVPVENAGFSILKATTVAPLASIVPGAGIVVSWTLAAICTVIPTNCFLFGRAIPRHVRQSAPETTVTLEDLRRFVPYDYVGSLFWLAATSLLPLVVIARVGASTSASFSLTWIIAYSLYLVSINLGSSLVAESSTDPSALRDETRRVRTHLLKVLVPCVGVIVVGAPLLLRLMGEAYATDGATVLRLLALSALPFIITATAISAYRARRYTRPVGIINAAVFGMVTVLTLLLLPVVGITGVGVAWLATQSAVALVLLAIEHRRFAAEGVPASTSRTGRGGLAFRLLLLPAARLTVPEWMVRHGGRLRAHFSEPRARKLILAALPDLRGMLPAAPDRPAAASRPCPGSLGPLRILPSASDRVVAILQQDGGPVGVLKVARTELALREFCAEQDVLRTLASDARLGPWRSMLPEAQLTLTDVGGVALERLVPGTDTANLLRATPTVLPVAMHLGLATIGELHRRTAHTVVVDDSVADRWLRPSTAVLRQRHPSGQVSRSQLEATDRLEHLLRRAIDGRHLGVGWVHGDFTPGNVMVDRDASRVYGILDWGQARSDCIPDLDVVLWLVALECQIRKWSMGRLVCQILASPAWPTDSLLEVSRGAMAPSGIGHHELVLWCWLEHVTGNLRKSERYERHPWWWAANVEPVLRAVAA